MGIETSAGNRKGKELKVAKGKNQNPTPNPPNPVNHPVANTNSRPGKKSRRRHQKKAVMESSPVQKLYDTCKDVFAISGTGIIPSPDKIQKLKAVLDGITLDDLGLDPAMPYFRRTVVEGGKSAIRYLHIHECDNFSMGIFCLPPSGVIPLHNHPGMTVFSKLLFGTMHIKAYDWAIDVPGNPKTAVDSSEVRPLDVQQPEVVKQLEVQQSDVKQPMVKQPASLAKVKINSEFTAPCDSCILYPADGGNMHCFTAVTACAVLDVLGPPYSDAKGRPCSYYFDYPFANFSVEGVSVPEEEKEGYAWLQEKEKPEDVIVLREMYEHRKIVK